MKYHPAKGFYSEADEADEAANAAAIRAWVTEQIEALPENASEIDLFIALFPPDWETLGEPEGGAGQQDKEIQP